MASLTWLPLSVRTSTIHRSGFCHLKLSKFPSQQQRLSFQQSQSKRLHLRCNKLFPWEDSSQIVTTESGDEIFKGRNIVEAISAEELPDIPVLQNEEDAVDVKNQPTLLEQPLKWPMWLLGPSVLLVTGMVPTLWLPLSSVFSGPNIAGLLSLLGLDCIFNMGATLFLLMADFCGRPKSSLVLKSQAPVTYRIWNLVASFIGFTVPLALFFASHKGSLQPSLSFISFAVLLGPYLLLLSVQTLTEMLTWYWTSPVWLVTPVVYEGYRVLQLMRGLQLAGEINAPVWMVESIRGLVSWWLLILGIQLMRIAWFAGVAAQKQS